MLATKSTLMQKLAVGLVLAGLCLGGAAQPPAVRAQGALLREAAERLLRSLGRYFGKEAAEETVERLARYGGRELVERAAQRAVREGGEEMLERVSAAAARHGPELLRAIDNAPSCRAVLRLVDELPAEQVAPALRRLAAGPQGRELAELAGRYGTRAIQAELRHPGLGTQLVKHLGDDGLRLAERLDGPAAMTVAPHAADIAALPAAQREGILRLLYEDTRRMVAFVRRFMEQNPGKTLFTAAATTIILANSDRLLGGDELAFDAQGNPIVVSKRGWIERIIGSTVGAIARPILAVMLPIAALAASAWLAIKLWFTYRLHQLKLHQAETQAKPSKRKQ